MAPLVAALVGLLIGVGVPAATATVIGGGVATTGAAAVKVDALARSGYAGLHASCPLAAPALDVIAAQSKDANLKKLAVVNDALCAAVAGPNTLINRLAAARALAAATHQQFDAK